MTADEQAFVRSTADCAIKLLPSPFEYVEVGFYGAVAGSMIGSFVSFVCKLDIVLVTTLCAAATALILCISLIFERKNKFIRELNNKQALDSRIQTDLQNNTVQVIRCTVTQAVLGREGAMFLDVGGGKTLFLPRGLDVDDTEEEDEKLPTADMCISTSALIYKIDCQGTPVRPTGKVWRSGGTEVRVLALPFHEIWNEKAQQLSAKVASGQEQIISEQT
jgi:hypothetical protein